MGWGEEHERTDQRGDTENESCCGGRRKEEAQKVITGLRVNSVNDQKGFEKPGKRTNEVFYREGWIQPVV